jgi:hypothetical protein
MGCYIGSFDFMCQDIPDFFTVICENCQTYLEYLETIFRLNEIAAGVIIKYGVVSKSNYNYAISPPGMGEVA